MTDINKFYTELNKLTSKYSMYLDKFDICLESIDVHPVIGSEYQSQKGGHVFSKQYIESKERCTLQIELKIDESSISDNYTTLQNFNYC